MFLLNHGETSRAPLPAAGPDREGTRFLHGRDQIFREVRVEYNYDPIDTVYREIAIVQDESPW